MIEKIIAIIPARGGSKSIPKKNILNLNGFPLIAYSIVACKLSKYLNRNEIIVSTDSVEIAEIAKKYGASIPFLRPPEISNDNSTEIEYIKHLINYFEYRELKEDIPIPEYIVQILPTTPLRDPALIDEAIEKFIIHGDKYLGATSLRSVHEIRESPFKLFEISNKGYLTGLTGLHIEDLNEGSNDLILKEDEYYNLPRQLFPKVYQPNGYIDIMRTDLFIDSGYKNLHGNKIMPFLTSNVGEIDSIDDLDYIQYLLEKKKWSVYEYLREH